MASKRSLTLLLLLNLFLCVSRPVTGTAIPLALSLPMEAQRDEYSLPQRVTTISAHATDDPRRRAGTFYDRTRESGSPAQLTVPLSPQPEMLAAFGASLLVAGAWLGRRRK